MRRSDEFCGKMLHTDLIDAVKRRTFPGGGLLIIYLHDEIVMQEEKELMESTVPLLIDFGAQVVMAVQDG